MTRPAVPEGVFASIAPLVGQTRRSRAADSAYLEAFPNESARAAGLHALLSAGAAGVVTMTHPGFGGALRTVWQRRRFPVLPIVPNVLAYVREATDHGVIGAGMRQVRRMGPIALAQLGARAAMAAPRVLRKDFPTLLDLLCRLEMTEYARFRPPAVFLHGQITDLLLALGNFAALRAFAAVVRSYGADPGLYTNNLGHLVPALERRGLDIPWIMTPLNPEGLAIKPDRATCAAIVRSSPERFIADRVVVSDAPDAPQRALAFLAELGVRRSICDFSEPERLREQRAALAPHSAEAIAG